MTTCKLRYHWKAMAYFSDASTPAKFLPHPPPQNSAILKILCVRARLFEAVVVNAPVSCRSLHDPELNNLLG